MAVWNVGMYSKSMTESSKSVLIEVLRILGSYKDYLVLTGGWAPYFILEKFSKRDQHCGSIDINFVLNPCLIDLKVYETIVSSIEKKLVGWGKVLSHTHTNLSYLEAVFVSIFGSFHSSLRML